MRQRGFVLAVSAAGVVAAVGCGAGGGGAIECESSDNCSLEGGGQCLPAPGGGTFCAYPDATCPGSGMRWSDLDVPGSIAGACVDNGADDAGVVDAPVVDAGIPDGWPGPDAGPGEWGLPDYVLNINTSVADELTPSASPDHLSLYFVRNGDIYVTTRGSTGALWGLATKVDALATMGATELSPEPSPDGLELYVVINNRIHRSTRASTSSAWEAPLLLWVESGRSPSLTGDGLTMYYVGGSYSVKRRTRASLSVAWGAEGSVSIPSDPSYDSVTISDDELTMLLSSAVDLDLPRVIELSRASTADPWGNLTEVATLTALDPTPRDCDFFADANAMYCALSDGTDYDIFYLERQ